MLQLRKEKGELQNMQLTIISAEMRQIYSNSGVKIGVKAQFHYPEAMR